MPHSSSSVNESRPSDETHIETSRIARATRLTSIGNLSSRIIGFVAIATRAAMFGTDRAVSAFELAANIPSLLNDVLIGRMMSSALVPTLSALSEDEQRSAFGKLLGALIGIVLTALSAIALLLLLFVQPLATLITAGQNQDISLVTLLMRITLPSIVFLSLAAIVSAALMARHRFEYTAFNAAAFNVVMIACTLLLAPTMGVASLALGMLLGSIVQFAMQLPGLRDVPVRLSLDWRHPGIHQIAKLYLPVMAGLVLAAIAQQASFTIANIITGSGVFIMRLAAQVIQFPLGLISAAISAAILPTLSRQAADATHDNSPFKQTLMRGLRLVWMFTVPATIGLLMLAEPVIALLFQRGAFDATSTIFTAEALRAAAPNLLFSAIDQPLIFAFYAQRNTRTPTLVGLISTMFYFVIVGAGMALWRAGLRTFTLADLVLCDSLKTGVDMLLMGWLLSRNVGGFAKRALMTFALKVLIASAAMASVVWLLNGALAGLFVSHTFITRAFALAVVVVAGAAVFGVLALLLRIEELNLRRFIKR